MNKIIKFTVLFVCVTIFTNCGHYNDNTIYDNHPSKRQFIKQMELMYEKDIIDFFPSIRQNPYIGSNCRAYNYSPWDDSTQSDFSACAYFSVNINSEMLDSLERMDYIEKIKYSDTLFAIDVPYMTYAESYRNTMKDSLQIPIADMRRHSYFTLGEYCCDTFFIGEHRFIEETEILPDDLVVYVIEAKSGNFWKNNEKAACEKRPILSEHWKHGYVKGITVSKKLSHACWWAMAW
jgi:hypothetical protein